VVVSSEESLVRPALENIKFLNYEDTEFLSWENIVLKNWWKAVKNKTRYF